MKERFIRFMQGRYGIDQLSKTILVVGLIIVLVSAFFGKSADCIDFVFYWMVFCNLLLFPSIFAKCK